MAAHSGFRYEALRQRNILPLTIHRDSEGLEIEVEIQANAQRLFAALTEPEFLEAWVTWPQGPFHLSPIVSRAGEDLHLAFIHPGSEAEVIMWENMVRRRRKIVFRWCRYLLSGESQSIVDIRLRGNFGNTVVHLNHSEIGNTEESAWFSQLWSNSLGKLSCLFQSPRPDLVKGGPVGHLAEFRSRAHPEPRLRAKDDISQLC